MKKLFVQLYALADLLLAVFTLLSVPSCTTQADKDRLTRIGDLVIDYAERTGKISPEDAALVREVGVITLSDETVLVGPEPTAPVSSK
jgi:hypothetical protein